MFRFIRESFPGLVRRRKEEAETMRRLLGAATCAVLLAAGGAFAGEVKGPSTPSNTNETGAPSHANSACAFNGLNDKNVGEGSTTALVQIPKDVWQFGAPPSTPGTECRGGTN